MPIYPDNIKSLKQYLSQDSSINLKYLTDIEKANIINIFLDEALDPDKKSNANILLLALLERIISNDQNDDNLLWCKLHQDLIKIIK